MFGIVKKNEVSTVPSGSVRMEEPEEEWNDREYSSQVCCRRSFILEMGLKLGKHVLVAGLVASSTPVVLPSIVVVSAIGLAVSMPSVFFLASHAFTHKLMSKLLPRPTMTSPLIFYSNCEEEKQEEEQERPGQQEMFFKGDIDMGQQNQELQEEKKGEIEMVQDIHNEENRMTLGNDYGQGVLMKDETERSQDGIHVIEDHQPKEDNNDYSLQEEKSPPKKPIDVKLEIGEDSKVEQPMMGGHGVVVTGLDKVSNDDIDESETHVEITSVAFEEFGDQAVEGDIKARELEKETKGLLEKIRDEGEKDDGVKYVKENDETVSPIADIDNAEIEWEDEHNCSIWRTEGEGSKDENQKANGGLLESSRAENMDAIHDEVESAQLIHGMPEENDATHSKGSQKPVAELCGLKNGGSVIYGPISTEPVEGLLNESQDHNTLAMADATDVTREKNNTHTIGKKEQNSAPDGPNILQEGRLEINMSNNVNQECQMHGYNETTSSVDADARGIDDQKFHFEKCAYTVEIHGESSDTIIEEHIDAMEVPVLSADHKSQQAESSSGKDVASPSEEVILNEEKIWKQILTVRVIVGYEATPQASCIDELKALYIFTGVEPPTLLNDSSDLSEINEKLQFLMSIVGVKLNAA